MFLDSLFFIEGFPKGRFQKKKSAEFSYSFKSNLFFSYGGGSDTSNIYEIQMARYGRVPYRDSVGNRVLVHLKVLLYPLGVGLTLN